jgi:monofunctional biosynthetic peptidoglycan transglycosylase
MIRLAFKFLLGIGFVAGLLLTYEFLNLPNVEKLKSSNPKTTALMQIREKQSKRRGLAPIRRQIWMPYKDFAANLKRAVILGEDAAFFAHQGVDHFELKEAIKTDLDKGRFKRGASTITMQLARNIYLSPEKSLLRKIREVMIAFQMEGVLSKQRIFELYLNVVEWGPGLYGAEMAARHYYSKSAADLSVMESATLAALLPDPLGSREKELMRRRNVILKRMLGARHITQSEFEEFIEKPLFYKANGFAAP